jgi:hypothetical protein
MMLSQQHTVRHVAHMVVMSYALQMLAKKPQGKKESISETLVRKEG